MYKVRVINFLIDYNSLKKVLKNIKQWNIRQGSQDINAFCKDFRNQMEILERLTNIIEQKTIVQVQSIGNSIMSIISMEKLRSEDKFAAIEHKMNEMTKILTDDFKNIREKISNYEELSRSKICKMKEEFLNSISNFLQTE